MFKRILPFLLLLGCGSELSPLMEVVVDDYTVWVANNTEDVQEELSDREYLSDTMLAVASQSWDSEYIQRDKWYGKDIVAGRARPWEQKVIINMEHDLWVYVADNYEDDYDAFHSCERVDFAYTGALVAYVLCHENAHIIGIINQHRNVYTVGAACKQAHYSEKVRDWYEDCEQ